MKCYIPEAERTIYQEFVELYEPYVFQGTAEFDKSGLKLEAERRCRFCKKAMPDTTFTKDAHKISRSLGNRHYLWDQECDKCNELFSRFEGDLAYFLGIDRTLYDIKPADKTPIFSSRDANVEARRFNADFMLIHRNDLSKGFEFDPGIGQFDIDVSRRPHIPAYVYNAFLKIALSILPDIDVADYAYGYRYILDRDNYGSLVGPRRVTITRINYGYPDPHAVLYRRKTSDTRYPYHLLAVYAQNLMFHIAFPFHVDELRGYPRQILVPTVPYIDFSAYIPEPINVERVEIDLHSTEKLKETDHKLHFKFDPEILNKLVAVQLPNDFLDNLIGKNRPGTT